MTAPVALQIGRVDPRSPVPRTAQVASLLLDAVASGDITGPVPQRALAKSAGVSLSTVRFAIEMLKAAGNVDTVPGVGTFVRPAPRAAPLALVRDAQSIAALVKGGRWSSTVRSSGLATAPEQSPWPGSDAWSWSWYLADQHKTCGLVQAWAPGRLEAADRALASPGEVLTALGRRLFRLAEVARLVVPRAVERAELGLESGNGLVAMVSSTGYDRSDRPLIYMEGLLSPAVGRGYEVTLGRPAK